MDRQSARGSPAKSNNEQDPRDQDSWRDIAERIQQEPDKNKIVDLVEQLITKFDAASSEHDAAPPKSDGANGSSPLESK
jgi:hypothetical protein